MTGIMEEKKDGQQTAGFGLNITITFPDAPHSLDLFTHFVLYQDRRSSLGDEAAFKACQGPDRLSGYPLLSVEQSRDADAGRSLQ